VELQPVRRRRAADVEVLLLGEVEEDAVADDVARGRGRHVLLGHVDGEVRDAVDRRVRNQLDRARATHEQARHVVRLIEEDGRLAPGALLAAPVRELGGDDRIHVGADLGVPQKLDRVRCGVEDVLQVLCGHRGSPLAVTMYQDTGMGVTMSSGAP
jgi:hypothetical protein